MVRTRDLVLTMLFAINTAQSTPAQPAPNQSISVDSCDLSWLWPVPTDASSVDSLISLDDLKSSDGTQIWTDQAFREFLEIAESDASAVKTPGGSVAKIAFSPAFRMRSSWKLAAFRIDPCAPGSSESIRNQFGETPQIRLIAQPVTIEAGHAVVHDVAAHLVFDYVAGRDAMQKAIPDEPGFRRMLDDLLILKQLCAENGIQTTGSKLNVHPGLQRNAVPGLTDAVRKFLQKHLQPTRMKAMAVMGLQFPEPWIFVATFRTSPAEGFQALPIPVFNNPAATSPAERMKTAVMLTFLETPHVLPVPQNSNRPIAAHRSGNKRGVSTAPLFEPPFNPNDPAQIGTDDTGMPILDAEIRNRDLADYIANPAVAHFFNTDCVSCHTESQRRLILNLPESPFAFKWPEGVSPLDDTVAQKDAWNVRNIGWFPDLRRGGETSATISQRTANETAEAVEFTNEKYLGDQGGG